MFSCEYLNKGKEPGGWLCFVQTSFQNIWEAVQNKLKQEANMQPVCTSAIFTSFKEAGDDPLCLAEKLLTDYGEITVKCL